MVYRRSDMTGKIPRRDEIIVTSTISSGAVSSIMFLPFLGPYSPLFAGLIGAAAGNIATRFILKNI